MNTEDTKIEAFVTQFKTNYMTASDWLFANDFDYNKAANDYAVWLDSSTQFNSVDYKDGWNDYTDGIIPNIFTNHSPYSKEYKDGWHDCVEATEKNGQQKKI